MKNLPENLLSEMSNFVSTTMGLYYPQKRWSTLQHQTNSAAKEFGFLDNEAFIQWLVSTHMTREMIGTLAKHFTIPETYFLREPQAFEALSKQILPELIRVREKNSKRLRIWCAGCASGEEPYSVAITLCELIPDIQNWNITLLATDINSRILNTAAIGSYGEWSFRNEPTWLKEKYFSKTDNGKYIISAEIRKMVTFTYLNLLEETYPSLLNDTNAMDIIFCRNVLMYFTPECAQLVAQRFYHSLIEGGWLLVSASELSMRIFNQFTSVNFPGTHLYHREIEKHEPLNVLPIPPKAVQRILSKQVSKKEKVVAIVIPQSIKEQEKMQTISSVDPKRMEALMSNMLLASEGKLNEALVACEQAIATDKLDITQIYLYASILQEKNRETDAIEAYQRVLYLDPNYIIVHFTLGNLYMRQGDVGSAMRYFKNVQRLLDNYDPDNILLEFEGLTVNRLKGIVHDIIQKGEQL